MNVIAGLLDLGRFLAVSEGGTRDG